ncbi:MAG: sigma-70 family RNA polymerase sigma factor [Polyangiaceae bacterium]
MVMPAGLEPDDRGTRLADPRLRRDIEAVVRRRVRGDDADDVVQAALADLLSAARVPEDREEFRRFVFAVARNKVFDHFRRRMREAPEEEAQEAPAAEEPLSARDILRWAEQKLPDAEAEHTLEWMLREGDGEKLEQIARDANLPAPRVRQRVSRLRRFLRERWAAELLLTGLGIALLAPVAQFYYRHWFPPAEIAEHDPILRPEPPKSPEQQGREARREALRRCKRAEDQQCLEGLDRARALDPTGDAAAEVVNARRAAAARLTPPPAPLPSSSSSVTPAPTASARPNRRFAIEGSQDSARTSLPRAIGTSEVPVPRFDSK